ncbi:glycerol-3-phosphate acyltransferase [Trifolium pratense]|uniref:Glycerol-3-phosphate acyltransferase n=2 Tax=Trifolium pratense TaxID=57577 RepID=A0A2K3LA99_TRIPR|nr:glycerol-3-phosphate acyltransferase [Trifolium pratense]
MSNHQTEADPAVISLLLELRLPYIAENLIYVAGDRVITDPLCKPFSIGRNLICVYSKKHMLDDPALVEMKRKANTRSLKEMATLLRSGSQIIWIAPSGGRDRPVANSGEWEPIDPTIHMRKHNIINWATASIRCVIIAAKPCIIR